MGNLWPAPQLCCGHKTALKNKYLTKTNLKNTRGKKEEKHGGREEGKASKKEEKISFPGQEQGAGKKTF